MKYLVTGANGFVGRALTAAARAAGDEVAAVVRSAPDAVTADAVHVVSDIATVEWSAMLRGIDVVVHTAAHVHVGKPTADDDGIFQSVNVDATERLARAAAASGVRRFVFVSSVKVHGDFSPSALTETSPLLPTDAYGRSKVAAEERLAEVVRQTGLDFAVIRPPLVYGPGVRANFLRLLQIVDRGIPLPFGRVHNRRSLVSLQNLVHAIRFIAGAESASGQTFLVSDDDDVSTSELVQRIARALGKSPRLLPVSPRLLQFAGSVIKPGAAERLLGSLYVDISRLRNAGWAPSTTMNEELTRTVEWFRKRETSR